MQYSGWGLTRAEGKENLPRPAGHTPLDAPQDPIGLLGNQDTLLAHGQLVVHEDTQSLSLQSCSAAGPPQACTVACQTLRSNYFPFFEKKNASLLSIDLLLLFITQIKYNSIFCLQHP